MKDHKSPLRTIKNPTKMEICLMAMVLAGPEGLHPFNVQVQNKRFASLLDKYNQYWTSCLSSDMSKLRRIYGIEIKSKFVPYISQYGHSTSFKCYWLANEEQAHKAIEWINYLRLKRGEVKLQPATEKALLFKYSLFN